MFLSWLEYGIVFGALIMYIGKAESLKKGFRY